MDIFSELKKLKTIKSNLDYAKRSRLAVLASAQSEPRPSVFHSVFMSSLKYGSALVLTTVMFAIILGGLSLSRTGEELATGLDLRSLRAEAQAIDIQIRLSNLGYDEFQVNPDLMLLDDKSGPVFGNVDSDKSPKETSGKGVDEAVSESNSSTESLTIEDVLEKLAQ